MKTITARRSPGGILNPFLVFLAFGLFTNCYYDAHAAAPTITNLRASQRAGTKLVDIYYDLADAESGNLAVTIAVSTNGGSSYNLSATSFTGAMGTGIAPGNNKLITWNAGADWNGNFSANVRFRVTADDDTTLAGLVAWYPLNGNGLDASGNGNNSIFNNATPTSDHLGNLNSAYSFDGTQYISAPDSSSLDFTNQFTLVAWVYPTSGALSASVAGVISKPRQSDGTGYRLGLNSGAITLAMVSNPGFAEVMAGSRETSNAWVHIAGTYDHNGVRLYRNGALIKTEPNINIVLLNSAQPLYIGTEGILGRTFQGKIDDVRIYDRALSDSEILLLYKSGLPPAPSGITLIPAGSSTMGNSFAE